MFHLQSLELLHWDYCRRVSMPLDGNIITIAGPNGSGKTTLLDAMRTLLGLECSGGRTYKTYARHANAETAWLRALVDNRPRGRQNSSRPFASSLLYSDQVTLACRISRQGGDWVRRYILADGVHEIEALDQKADKDWLGIEAWKKRLEAAGLTRAIGRVLALEQGQTDRLCELSPKELLRLVFEVFGDQEVLDRYELARNHQQQLLKEVEQATHELSHAQAQLSDLSNRVNSYQQYQLRLKERERLATEVVPVLQWSEQRQRTAQQLRDLHRQRLFARSDERGMSEKRAHLLSLFQAQEAARNRQSELESQRKEARQAFEAARDGERPMEALVKREEDLKALAAVETDGAALTTRLEELGTRQHELRESFTRHNDQLRKAQSAMDALSGQRLPPPPQEVTRFRKALDEAGIQHHVLADCIDISDDQWRAAAEGFLRPSRWVVVLAHSSDEAQAYRLASRERYRHYVVADGEQAPAVSPKHSLLSVLKFNAKAPGWLLRQLASIRCVADTEEGARVGGEWITPDAYYRDGRGGRSLWVEPREFQFGVSALDARRASLEKELARYDLELSRIAKEQVDIERQLKDAHRAAQGHKAAQELVERAEEFAQARARLPGLRQSRIEASTRMAALDQEHDRAVAQGTRSERDYEAAQASLKASEENVSKAERDWASRRDDLLAQARLSREAKARFPSAWTHPTRLAALRDEFENAKQAEIAARHVQQELDTGVWETDPQVQDRHARMQVAVLEQTTQLDDRRASNEMARIAAFNARERYIDVLRATVRRYKKNVQELGELAGVHAQAELPHLDNDDTVLAQAGLHVKFNFDGKGEVGLNDGEASGGQQVLKSLILLVGLMKDDDAPGGFVFIDEPFAHLDVRNIQLVGHFLKSTRAQYLLTTPITHNVEVFEPSEITLVTSKKPRGERWAPPIAVLARRPEESVYG
ncbi:ATP-binding protein [Roseateles depolymerans]|uniref:RecF/RecN/SMC N-terminal domain-containing protein n=1 Tax=Roseateles depolymerans TaxID=76731 RepID=A0A0U3N1G1_9BURK|nr:ATP-binding protein [Roseateles depolymerans]ALV08004.1 RecF/RecN/SMC N-terminal domain-containing protein [Roseateles depolymerans]REG21776.1 AAA domain-containing protein [Roseateles depolymerans]